MTTKASDKAVKANRSTKERRAPRNKLASLPDRAASTTASNKRKAAPTKQPID